MLNSEMFSEKVFSTLAQVKRSNPSLSHTEAVTIAEKIALNSFLDECRKVSNKENRNDGIQVSKVEKNGKTVRRVQIRKDMPKAPKVKHYWPTGTLTSERFRQSMRKQREANKQAPVTRVNRASYEPQRTLKTVNPNFNAERANMLDSVRSKAIELFRATGPQITSLDEAQRLLAELKESAEYEYSIRPIQDSGLVSPQFPNSESLGETTEPKRVVPVNMNNPRVRGEMLKQRNNENRKQAFIAGLLAKGADTNTAENIANMLY